MVGLIPYPSLPIISSLFGALLSLPETRLLELLHIELDVLLGDDAAEAGLLGGSHKESSCKKATCLLLEPALGRAPEF